MENTFYAQIANSNAHRPIRDLLSRKVLSDESLLPQLMDIALHVHDVNHHKACWILELVIEVQINLLTNYIDTFTEALSAIKHDGALRSVSKICLFAIKHSEKHPEFLKKRHTELITEACFDWLIDPEGKVATKAYAMRTLQIAGKTDTWIYPELHRILQEDTLKHTAAYRSAAKDVLRKISEYLTKTYRLTNFD